MSETLEERKARVMAHLQKQGEGGFYDFPVAPAINGESSPGAMYAAWEALLNEGQIEIVRGSWVQFPLARFRLVVEPLQMRLL